MAFVLSSLLASVPGSMTALDPTIMVHGLQDDSRKVKPGELFFAVAGSHGDGLAYGSQALAAGALAVVSERSPGEGLPWIQVPNAAEARRLFAETFHGHPASAMRFHGVTGTSGKTTTAFLLEAMLAAAEGHRPALMGTVLQRYPGYSHASALTTAGTLELQEFLAGARRAGVTDVTMEMSSHALDQGRARGIEFRTALFTNLTRDHLDYHKDMETYHRAKLRLFTDHLAPGGAAVIHTGGAGGERMAADVRATGARVITASLKAPADVCAVSFRNDENGVALEIPALGTGLLESSLFGEFNGENLVLAVAAALEAGVPAQAIRAGALAVRVPGRFEMAFNDGNRRVVVDYAHKPDALKRVLQSARTVCKGKLHCLFGCGGDRDQGKRPMMGRISAELADYSWITSDNPRTEAPAAILAGIVAGVPQGACATVIEDRSKAIHAACAALQDGDWLVVAGKGHEDYQIVGTVKHHFDDREVVKEAMAAC